MKELLDYLDNMIAALTVAACGLVYVSSDDDGLSWLILFGLWVALILIGLVKWAIRGRKYWYLISYFHSKGNGRWIGYIPKRIESEDDICTIEPQLQNEFNLEKVGITGYQLVSKR